MKPLLSWDSLRFIKLFFPRKNMKQQKLSTLMIHKSNDAEMWD